MNAEQWNARYEVGTLVFAYPGCRPEDGTGTRLVTRTRTEAQLSASGDPVVWVEGEGSYICLTHVDPVAEDVWEEAREAETAARAEPLRQTSAAYRASEAILQRQIDEQAKEIDRLRSELTAFGALELGDLDGRVSATCAEAGHPTWLRTEDDNRGCPWCRIAELAAVRAERDQARADSERLRAAHFHEAARLLEDTGHDDDAVNLLDTLADGIHAEAEDASDNRRRLFVDDKGNGWISVCHDEGTEWIVPVQPEAAVEQDVRDVADETGSLREIGRCW